MSVVVQPGGLNIKAAFNVHPALTISRVTTDCSRPDALTLAQRARMTAQRANLQARVLASLAVVVARLAT